MMHFYYYFIMTVIIFTYIFLYYSVYLCLALLVFNFYINIFEQFNFSLFKNNIHLFTVQASMIDLTHTK